jgi:retinoid hydroxylase
MLAIGASHWMPELFERPEQFDPDRFAPPREEDKRHPYALATFGGGPRICIGVNFAQVEVKALVAHILRSYTLQPIVGREPEQEYEGLLGNPTNGIWVRVQPRAQ